MKNQYFGDRRDFFKYCFLLEIVGGISTRRLSIIPLLTPDDGQSHGRITSYKIGEYGGHRNLWEFLQGCLARNDRRLVNLRQFMNRVGVDYVPYRDDKHFTHEGRLGYFEEIPDTALREAVVFFDPDNGFEVNSMSKRNGEKYIRYIDLAYVMKRMGNDSIAVIYQHLPRRQRHIFFSEISEKVKGATHAERVFFVSDNVVAFVVIRKICPLYDFLPGILQDYSNAHGLAFYNM